MKFFTRSSLVSSIVAISLLTTPMTAFADVTGNMQGASGSGLVSFISNYTTNDKSYADAVIHELFSGKQSISPSSISTSTLEQDMLSADSNASVVIDSNISISNDTGTSYTSGGLILHGNGNTFNVQINTNSHSNETTDQSLSNAVVQGTVNSHPVSMMATWSSTAQNIPYIPSTKSSIDVNGNKLYSVSTITYQKTAYMPIWYVMQAVKKIGLSNTWDGTTWNIMTSQAVSGSAQGVGYANIALNGHVQESCDSIVLNGTTYMPIWYVMQALKKSGHAASWSGTALNLS